MASRKASDLTPTAQNLFHALEYRLKREGLLFILTCTARTVYEQAALYVQGRYEIDVVNSFRKFAGLPGLPIRDNRIVTWTMDSAHIVTPAHPLSRAFDIALIMGRNIPHWNMKADINENQIPDYKEAAAIGAEVGLVCGAYFTTPDWCHFEEPAE